MGIREGMELIEHAFEKDDDEKLYSRWIVGPQFQMSFEKFKQELKPPVFKSEKELMADVEKILEGAAKHGNI